MSTEEILAPLVEYVEKARKYHDAVDNYFRVNRSFPASRGPNGLTREAVMEMTKLIEDIRARGTR